MEEKRPDGLQEEYIPRPRWQIWGARAALVFVLIALALYYWSVANPF